MSGDEKTLLPKPPWLRKKLYNNTFNVDRAIEHNGLETICKEAACPNRSECWHAGTATFLILGRICTRKCTFCNVESGTPGFVDPLEPTKVADAVEALKLNYTVITSVNRDDLPDGGAQHFVDVIRAVRERRPDNKIEVLIPDLLGDWEALRKIVDVAPEVLNHNIETIEPFYYYVRPKADYRRSLELFSEVKRMAPSMVTKSGIMVGMGEDPNDVRQAFRDLLEAGVDVLTVGQYLQPTRQHLDVEEYVTPEQFEAYAEYAYSIGFKGVASGVFVRSSYKADELYAQARQKIEMQEELA
ncbi:lipoyl synthase [Candidatus Haliotispira prima]|uniref:Lipoyl synthase n=1 Tax=Candidatus Haliotispira prima TaxID=3034016 RepID=A0ABY8MLC5_9SPIO|nr:lipoyl synthase [Candidatus Haliotispira prima]